MTVITAVVGPPGIGKTTWIRQQLASSAQPAVYFSPGNTAVPIDQTALAADLTTIQTLSDGQESELIKNLAAGTSTYIELGFHLDLEAMNPLLDAVFSRRVAIVPPGTKDSQWHQWASEIVEGIAVETSVEKAQLWRANTSGQVIDLASLNVFWYELTEGAYGKVYRAKGIFDGVDGRAFYFDFVVGIPESVFSELNVYRWLEGRPQRFSGIEVLGIELDEKAIAQTLKDFCLDDSAIAYYQKQIKEQSLENSEEVIS